MVTPRDKSKQGPHDLEETQDLETDLAPREKPGEATKPKTRVALPPVLMEKLEHCCSVLESQDGKLNDLDQVLVSIRRLLEGPRSNSPPSEKLPEGPEEQSQPAAPTPAGNLWLVLGLSQVLPLMVLVLCLVLLSRPQPREMDSQIEELKQLIKRPVLSTLPSEEPDKGKLAAATAALDTARTSLNSAAQQFRDSAGKIDKKVLLAALEELLKDKKGLETLTALFPRGSGLTTKEIKDGLKERDKEDQKAFETRLDTILNKIKGGSVDKTVLLAALKDLLNDKKNLDTLTASLPKGPSLTAEDIKKELQKRGQSDQKEFLTQLTGLLDDKIKALRVPSQQEDVLILVTHSPRLLAKPYALILRQVLEELPRDKDRNYRVGLFLAVSRELTELVGLKDRNEDRKWVIGDRADNASEELEQLGPELAGVFEAGRANRRCIVVASTWCKPPPVAGNGWSQFKQVDVVLIQTDATRTDGVRHHDDWLNFCTAKDGQFLELKVSRSEEFDRKLKWALTSLSLPRSFWR
jgi:hypothetical protein